jgi:hypothetical protein
MYLGNNTSFIRLHCQPCQVANNLIVVGEFNNPKREHENLALSGSRPPKCAKRSYRKAYLDAVPKVEDHQNKNAQQSPIYATSSDNKRNIKTVRVSMYVTL